MEEQNFRSMMQQSKLEIQFPEFDEEVMDKIKTKEATRRSVWRNLKISWVFFFIGAFLGVFATQLFVDVEFEYLGKNSKLVLLAGEILIVLIVSFQFDKLFRFTVKIRD